MEIWVTRLKRTFWGAVVLVMLIVFTPYGPDFYEMERQREIALAAKPTEFTVGVSWPIAVRGESLVNGIELAVSRIEQLELLSGLPIELVIRDDQGTTAGALAVATEFANMPQMSAVIGYADNSQAAAVTGIYQTVKLLQVVIGASSTELVRTDQPYLVRTTLSARKVAQQLVSTLSNDPIKFAVITERNGYQEEFAEEFSILELNKGSTRVFNSTYPSEIPPDFVRAAHEIRYNLADFIVFAGQSAQAANFALQAHRIGLEAPIICSCTDGPTIKRIAGQAAQNVVLPRIYEPTIKNSENLLFVAAYQQRFGMLPDQWAAQGYDAMLILAHAVANSGGVIPMDLAWSIRYMAPILGASGRFVFSPSGDITEKPLYIHSIRGLDDNRGSESN